MDKTLKNNYTMGSLPKRPYQINQMEQVWELCRVMKEKENIDIPVSEELSVLHQRYVVGKKVIPNALAVHPSM